MKIKLVLAAACSLLMSCSSIEQEKANVVIDTALEYALRSGKITPEDAALVRDLKGTLLAPTEVTAQK